MALKIVVITREQGTGFGQLYFSLLMSVFFRSPTYSDFRVNEPHFISHAKAQRRKGRKE
ncbi:MAG: hypothetical protein ACKOQN_19685 [Dolichospermum sp.]